MVIGSLSHLNKIKAMSYVIDETACNSYVNKIRNFSFFAVGKFFFRKLIALKNITKVLYH